MIWWFKSSTVAPGKFLIITLQPTFIIHFLKHHGWWTHKLLMLCSLPIVLFLLLYFPWQYYFETFVLAGNIFLFFILTSFSCFFIESLFSQLKLFISCWESFWSVLVLLISGALISSLRFVCLIWFIFKVKFWDDIWVRLYGFLNRVFYHFY